LFLLGHIEQLTMEQLNKIPTGFNNNIIWNMAHMVSALQAICYKRAGLTITIDEKYVAPFLTNTKPEGIVGAEEIDAIKALLISTVDQLQHDYEKNIFNVYTPSPNILSLYNISLSNIDEALDFLLYHDGFHAGSISAIKHLV
jgi:hypothetical protein